MQSSLWFLFAPLVEDTAAAAAVVVAASAAAASSSAAVVEVCIAVVAVVDNVAAAAAAEADMHTLDLGQPCLVLGLDAAFAAAHTSVARGQTVVGHSYCY